jgi:hypothetical protein
MARELGDRELAKRLGDCALRAASIVGVSRQLVMRIHRNSARSRSAVAQKNDLRPKSAKERVAPSH